MTTSEARKIEALKIKIAQCNSKRDMIGVIRYTNELRLLEESLSITRKFNEVLDKMTPDERRHMNSLLHRIMVVCDFLDVLVTDFRGEMEKIDKVVGCRIMDELTPNIKAIGKFIKETVDDAGDIEYSSSFGEFADRVGDMIMEELKTIYDDE